MDKTYSDLMDIVNRTKKFDSKPERRPARRPEPEVVEEDFEPREYDIEEPKKRTRKASSVFGEDSAIGKAVTKTKTAKKTSTAKKKTTTKKATTKKEEKEEVVEEKKTLKAKAQPKPEATYNPTDPKNDALYAALKSSLFSGGTDISEYMTEEDERLMSTQSTLQDLKAKKEAQKINAEITKEQQEYEQLFTGSLGSFYNNEEENEEETDAEPVDVAKKNVELSNELNKIKATLASKKSPTAAPSVAREERNPHDATFELETGNKDLDKKIAEYYKRKQEKINQYKAQEENYMVEEKKEDDNAPVDYESIFGGAVMSRDELLGIKPAEPVVDEVEEPQEMVEEVEETVDELQSELETTNEEETSAEEPATEEETVKEPESKEEHLKSILSGLLFNKKKEEPVETAEVETPAEEQKDPRADYASIWEQGLSAEPTEEVPATETEETQVVEEKVTEGDNFVMQGEGLELDKEVTTTDVVEYEERVPALTEEVTDAVEEEPQTIEETEPTETEEPAEEVEEEPEEIEEDDDDDDDEERISLDFGDDEDGDDYVVRFGRLNNKEDDDEEDEVSDTEELEEVEENATEETVEEVAPAIVEEEEESTEIEPVDAEQEDEEIQDTQPEETLEIEESEVAENPANVLDEILNNNNLEDIDGIVADPEHTIEEVEALEENTEDFESPSIDDAEAQAQIDEVMEEATAETEEVEEIEEQETPVVEEPAVVAEEQETPVEEVPTEEEIVVPVEETEELVQESTVETVEETEEVEKESAPVEELDNFDEIVRNERLYEQSRAAVNTAVVDSSSEDNTFVMNVLPEEKFDLFGRPVEVEEQEEEEKAPVVEEKEEMISKEEFYNEMARLQENLINELKGNKVEKSTFDFFAEKPEPEPVVMTEAEKVQKAEEIVDKFVEDFGDEMAAEAETETKEETQEETIKEESQVGINAEPVDPADFDNYNLLNKDIALNEQDLAYQEEEQEEKQSEKDAYFYLSPEHNEKESAIRDEYMDLFQDEPHNAKDVGDINFFKSIGNAIPSSEILKQETAPQVTEEEVEAIYTLMGIQKKPTPKEENDIKVLYVASECQPFAASGGLADVTGSLPKAIAKQGGVDIRVIMPLYGNIKNEYRDEFEYLGNFTVHLSWRQEYCGLFRYFKDGVTYYFIDNERYFKRDSLYGYYDDGERFAYFSKAVVESLPHLNFFPDIIHCCDWQSALVSAYVKTGSWSDFRYYKIKHIYTIHNVEYQGVYGMENLKDLFGIDFRFKNDMEYNGDINLTKAAIQFSDKFSTVSHSYCDNLKQPYCSRGLHHIIIRNEYKLSGILNGIDYDFYNPATDRHIFKNYDYGCMEEKVLNKKLWQDEMGLPVDGDTPMISIVSRLANHKGMDLIMKVIENTLQQDIQLVVVGTGEEKYTNYFKMLENKYPTKVRAFVDKYSNELARKAYAASDIFLMPSKIEPCGLSQMIASRYGTVPIVREVGGLRDSIKDFGCEGGGNGYTFTNYNPNDLSYQLDRAIKDYSNKSEWKEKMKICMSMDFTWDKPAREYIDLYKSVMDN